MSAPIAAALKRRVRKRAGARCEYCRMPEPIDQLPFQIDHVIARQHGGSSSAANLAFSCAYCNGHKGTNLAGIDPTSRRVVRLFNPRRDQWAAHFRWNGPRLVGATAIGRATVVALRINDAINVALRRSLIARHLFQ